MSFGIAYKRGGPRFYPQPWVSATVGDGTSRIFGMTPAEHDALVGQPKKWDITVDIQHSTYDNAGGDTITFSAISDTLTVLNRRTADFDSSKSITGGNTPWPVGSPDTEIPLDDQIQLFVGDAFNDVLRPATAYGSNNRLTITWELDFTRTVNSDPPTNETGILTIDGYHPSNNWLRTDDNGVTVYPWWRVSWDADVDGIEAATYEKSVGDTNQGTVSIEFGGGINKSANLWAHQHGTPLVDILGTFTVDLVESEDW